MTSPMRCSCPSSAPSAGLRSLCRRPSVPRDRSSRRTPGSARAFRTFTSTSCHGTRATGSSRRGSSGSGGNTRRIRTWQRPRRRSAPPTRRRDKAPAEAGASRVAGGVDPSALPVHLNVPASEQTFGQRAGRRDDLEVVVAAGLALVDQEHFAAIPAQDGASLELRAVEATRVEALCIGVHLVYGEGSIDV